jgi:hypothetical protein
MTTSLPIEPNVISRERNFPDAPGVDGRGEDLAHPLRHKRLLTGAATAAAALLVTAIGAARRQQVTEWAAQHQLATIAAGSLLGAGAAGLAGSLVEVDEDLYPTVMAALDWSAAHQAKLKMGALLVGGLTGAALGGYLVHRAGSSPSDDEESGWWAGQIARLERWASGESQSPITASDGTEETL